MKKIKRYVKQIDDEICGAKDYAEKYVEEKSKGDTQWASKYKEMANDELKHATYLHDKAVKDIEELNKIFKPTEEMQDKWDRSHAEYVERTAWVKTMLAM